MEWYEEAKKAKYGYLTRKEANKKWQEALRVLEDDHTWRHGLNRKVACGVRAGADPRYLSRSRRAKKESYHEGD